MRRPKRVKGKRLAFGVSMSHKRQDELVRRFDHVWQVDASSVQTEFLFMCCNTPGISCAVSSFLNSNSCLLSSRISIPHFTSSLEILSADNSALLPKQKTTLTLHRKWLALLAWEKLLNVTRKIKISTSSTKHHWQVRSHTAVHSSTLFWQTFSTKHQHVRRRTSYRRCL